jgi:predicted 3-demethylubiquinone-9 3-methyltransferase (glyoxalase superfamily)
MAPFLDDLARMRRTARSCDKEGISTRETLDSAAAAEVSAVARQCGWCKDRWGLSWQITPRVLTDALAVGGGEAKRAFEAMMTMKKIDIAATEAARRG